MTKEEAIKNIKEHCYFANLIPRAKESLDMAIKVLEQEACEDAISRQAVSVMLHNCELHRLADKVMDTNKFPSVTPKPKTGHWIDAESLDSALWYACSECGETEFHATNYCPNCGAKMEREE